MYIFSGMIIKQSNRESKYVKMSWSNLCDQSPAAHTWNQSSRSLESFFYQKITEKQYFLVDRKMLIRKEWLYFNIWFVNGKIKSQSINLTFFPQIPIIFKILFSKNFFFTIVKSMKLWSFLPINFVLTLLS